MMGVTPADWHRQTSLRDGTPAVLRVMRPSDRDGIVAAFARLDRASVYTRFFSFRRELPESALARIGEIDFFHLAGLVVTIGSGGGETIVGTATYVAAPAPHDGAMAAEVAFTIEEDYQGQGLAGQLLAALADIARRHGIVRLTAEVLADNTPMLAVFRRSGLPMRQRREGGVIQIELDLGPQAQDGSPASLPAD
jgi:RimJ/RimL family protein N-acetyltransferase